MNVKTLYEVLQNSLKQFPTRTAFSLWRGADVTYSEVGSRVAQIQEMLVDADIQPGDRVAILSSSVPNWGVAYFAIASAGYVVVPIMPDFTSDDIDRIIEHSETKALFVSDRLFSKLSKSTAEKLNIVIRTKNLGVIAQNVKGGSGSSRIPQPDDLAAIIYTSGTTSNSKGVMIPYRAACAYIRVYYRSDSGLLSRFARGIPRQGSDSLYAAASAQGGSPDNYAYCAAYYREDLPRSRS